MKIKDCVILAGLDKRMRKALIVADEVWLSYGQDLVITSGLDGAHSAGSYHYYGCAIDCRTRYFRNTQAAMVADTLSYRLGEDFKVIVEPSHIHIQLREL